MKLSELIKALNYALEEHGDMDIIISTAEEGSSLSNQNYTISEPNTLICEKNEDSGLMEYWIRDWPY